MLCNMPQLGICRCRHQSHDTRSAFVPFGLVFAERKIWRAQTHVFAMRCVYLSAPTCCQSARMHLEYKKAWMQDLVALHESRVFQRLKNTISTCVKPRASFTQCGNLATWSKSTTWIRYRGSQTKCLQSCNGVLRCWVDKALKGKWLDQIGTQRTSLASIMQILWMPNVFISGCVVLVGLLPNPEWSLSKDLSPHYLMDLEVAQSQR